MECSLAGVGGAEVPLLRLLVLQEMAVRRPRQVLVLEGGEVVAEMAVRRPRQVLVLEGGEVVAEMDHHPLPLGVMKAL